MPPESPTQDLAQTVQEVSERVSLLVREEIELAKAEVAEKVTKLLRGVVIGVAAGIFAVVGLLFVLHGMAWLAWYVLPLGDSQSVFWGYFFVAGLLFVLGGISGYLAARFFRQSTPPVPEMAIDEAGKIKRTLTFWRRRKA
ncbi:MAG TPA: phage holin family protein [Solirubrobacteraceae bacterium]|nr:phage holin family protein [Solirubrobacteraceae bacterium]